MANYTYKCDGCKKVSSLSYNVSEYASLVELNHFDDMWCDKCCNNQKFIRVFGDISSKISKDKDTLMLEIKEEARKISEKVKLGDQKLIREIYGE